MNWKGLIEIVNIIIWSMVAGACLGLLCGCEEAQQQDPQQSRWGEGETNPNWQKFFGDNNMARLNFVQTNVIDRHGNIIFGLTGKDPNGQSVRKRGLIERVTTLESLGDRVKELEENDVPNKNNLFIGKTVWWSCRGQDWKGIVLGADGSRWIISRSDGLIDRVLSTICSFKDPNVAG